MTEYTRPLEDEPQVKAMMADAPTPEVMFRHQHYVICSRTPAEIASIRSEWKEARELTGKRMALDMVSRPDLESIFTHIHDLTMGDLDADEWPDVLEDLLSDLSTFRPYGTDATDEGADETRAIRFAESRARNQEAGV